jgi:outer membrane scaffolding protein for murein synthesis (MipA/OmpV family)
MTRTIAAGLAALTLAALAVPAAAQDVAAPTIAAEPSVFDGDWLTVGAGALYGPSYEGSDDYVVDPVPVVQGRLLGIGISSRPSGVALDLINDGGNAVSFSLGPSARLRSNRHSHIKDPVVASLGKLRRAIEVGASAGVSFNKVLNPYDSLSFSADVRWDVNDAHNGMVIDPAVSYFTPLSKGIAVIVGVDAEWADDKFMDYYFSVSPAGSAVSGLPAFRARSGWRRVGANLLGAFDLDGNLANGGLSVVAFGNYSRLLGDAADSPITSIRGSADQWTAGLGLGFTF